MDAEAKSVTRIALLDRSAREIRVIGTVRQILIQDIYSISKHTVFQSLPKALRRSSCSQTYLKHLNRKRKSRLRLKHYRRITVKSCEIFHGKHLTPSGFKLAVRRIPVASLHVEKCLHSLGASAAIIHVFHHAQLPASIALSSVVGLVRSRH